MSGQRTLLTCHKGVDLHAATALRVMRAQLDGGQHLVALARAEYVTWWQDAVSELAVSSLLKSGRYFNPNKHHYGHFSLQDSGQAWHQSPTRSGPLPASWPGMPLATDWGEATADLYDRLLGGVPAAGCTAVDVCAFPLGEKGPLLNGILWRLTLRAAAEEALELADRLAVTRHRREGLLVNPHMQGWRWQVRDRRATRSAPEAGIPEKT